MVDFAKLNDPVEKARIKAKIEADGIKIAEEDKKLRQALRLCEDKYDDLTEKERSFIKSIRFKVTTYSILSPPQLKWIFDIEQRITSVPMP